MTDNPPAGIHPLRERLDGWSWRTADGTRAVALDSAIEIVADWLREEATISPGAVAERQFVLNRLADAIYPKEAHDGQ